MLVALEHTGTMRVVLVRPHERPLLEIRGECENVCWVIILSTRRQPAHLPGTGRSGLGDRYEGTYVMINSITSETQINRHFGRQPVVRLRVHEPFAFIYANRAPVLSISPVLGYHSNALYVYFCSVMRKRVGVLVQSSSKPKHLPRAVLRGLPWSVTREEGLLWYLLPGS